MRIEAGQNAVDRALDQRLVVDLVDIFRTHLFEHVHQLIELLIGVGLARRLGGGSSGDQRDRAGRKKKTQRSEEHTSELQSLMRISYAVFCLKKKNQTKNHKQIT